MLTNNSIHWMILVITIYDRRITKTWSKNNHYQNWEKVYIARLFRFHQVKLPRWTQKKEAKMKGRIIWKVWILIMDIKTLIYYSLIKFSLKMKLLNRSKVLIQVKKGTIRLSTWNPIQSTPIKNQKLKHQDRGSFLQSLISRQLMIYIRLKAPTQQVEVKVVQIGWRDNKDGKILIKRVRWFQDRKIYLNQHLTINQTHENNQKKLLSSLKKILQLWLILQ